MTVYPQGIDSVIELPTVVDNITPVDADAVNRLRDSIIAIQSELGIKPSGTYTTVRLRLDALETVITSLSITSGAGTPLGPASGDLSGTYPSPTVVKIQGRSVSNTLPSTGQVLGWNGTTWLPITVTGGAAFTISSFSTTTTLVQVSQTVATPAFTASYSAVTDSATLDDNYGSPSKNVSSTPTSFTSNNSFVKTSWGQSTIFTLTATSGTGTATAMSTITWTQKAYWGVGAAGQSSAVFIQSLAGSGLTTSRATSFLVSPGATEKIYYAYRTGYGVATFTVGGFEGGFTLVSTTISVTNTYGFTENYTLYESDNLGLGSTIVVVS